MWLISRPLGLGFGYLFLTALLPANPAMLTNPIATGNLITAHVPQEQGAFERTFSIRDAAELDGALSVWVEGDQAAAFIDAGGRNSRGSGVAPPGEAEPGCTQPAGSHGIEVSTAFDLPVPANSPAGGAASTTLTAYRFGTCY